MTNSDVQFRGVFDLSQATTAFDTFVKEIKQRLAALSGQIEQSALGDSKRQQKITDDHLAYNIAQAKKETKAKEEELNKQTKDKEKASKQQTAEQQAEARRQQKITDDMLKYNVGQSKVQATRNRVLAIMGITEDGLAEANKKLIAFRDRVATALQAGLIDPRKAESSTQSLTSQLQTQQKVRDALLRKIQEGIPVTQQEILQLRKVNDELLNFDTRINKAERSLSLSSKSLQDSSRKFNEFFKATVIGGFALQQLGGFLNANVTQPLIRLGKEVLETTLRFDTLETLLRERAGKTFDEIGASIDTVGRVAKLRNFDLETSVTLYSRLFEATRGALDDKLFETLGKGLSNVLTTIEAGEKRAFFGQIQDILGGGQVANLEKTLSLAPALKTVYDEIKRGTDATGQSLTQQELLTKSFEKLAQLPALDNLETKVKNIRVQFELWENRLGRIYKEQLLRFITFIKTRIIPAIDALLTKFENLDPSTQTFVLGLIAATAALAPLAYTLGTLGVVLGGVAYLVKALSLAMAFLTGSTVATEIAASNLTTLVAAATGSGGALSKVGAFLIRLPTLLNPVTLILTALAATIGYVLYNNIGGARDAVIRLASTISTTLYSSLTQLVSILSNIISLTVSIITLGQKIDGNSLLTLIGKLVEGLGEGLTIITLFSNVLRPVADILNFLVSAVGESIPIAFAKAGLAQLEFIKLLKESSILFGRLITFAEGLGGKTTEQLITEQKKKVKDLGGVIQEENKKNVQSVQNVVIAQTDFTKRLLATAAGVKVLTDALKDQNKELRDAAYNYGKFAFQQAGKKSEAAADSKIAGLDEAIGDADLTDNAQRQAAYKRVLEANRVQLSSATAAQGQQNYVTLQDEYRKQRESLVKLAETETDKTLKDLYLSTAKVYDKYATTPDKIFPSLDEVFGEVFKDKGSPIAQNELTIRKYFSLLQSQIEFVKKQSGITTDSVDQAQQENQKRIKEFNKRVNDANEAIAEEQRQQGLQPTLDTFDDNIASLDEQKKRLLNQKEDVIDVNAVLQDLTEIYKTLEQNLRDKAEAEKAAIDTGGGTALEKLKEQNRINAELNQNLKTLRRDNISDEASILENLTGKSKQNAEALRETLLSFRDVVTNNLDLAIEIATKGGKVDETLIKQMVDEFDRITDNAVYDKLRKVVTGIQEVQKLVKQEKLNPEDLQDYKDFQQQLNDFSEIIQKGNVTAEQLTAMIQQSETVGVLLENIAKAGEFASESDKANFQILLQKYVDFIKGLRDAKGLLTDKTTVELESLKVKQASLESQQEINDLVGDELDLTKQILEVRRERGYLAVPDLKNFGKGLIDILTRGSKAQYELQKKILENQITGAQIELDLAITRLKIEQEILILKLEAAGKTKEEIDTVRQQFNKQIEELKKRAELQKTLLKEQIDSLNEFGSTIGDIIVSSITQAVGGLLGGKKKTDILGDAPTVDDTSSTHTIDIAGGDPEEINTGLHEQGQILDDTAGSVDELDAKYQKIAKTAGVVASALLNMNDLSLKSIRNALAETLNAIAQEAAVRALQYAAIAISAAVFGDWGTAARAGVAALAWGGVAVAAKVGAMLVGTSDAESTANAQSSAASSAGVTTDGYDPDRNAAILRQKAASIFINLDIRTDDGIIVKKSVKAINTNTELRNLIQNSDNSFAFSPTP